MKKDLLLPVGILASAAGVFASWLCCLLPVTVGVLGVGSAALGSRLEPYRPLFFMMTCLMLVVAFYRVYRPSRRACETCAPPGVRRRQRLVVWIVAFVALTLMTSPYWIGLVYWVE